ncbi:hypothetical protein QZH45_09515 [Pseudomonas corrugata]|uniref:hypothetical protein n=1 Tax=Pseudomonas corrugata TaxID=47879 RepID=UPI003D815086
MFALDRNAACAADNKSAFIDDAGKYIGTFTRAELVKGQTGSVGLGLTFKTDGGSEAQFYINTSYLKDGQMQQNNGGAQTVSAILACLRLNGSGDPAPVTVEKWNSETKQREKVQIQGFPALMNKPIGLLLQMEIEKTSEKGLPRPTIYAPFSAESEKTASEILSKVATPAKLEKMVQAVMAKPLIDRRPKGQVSTDTYSQSQDQSSPPDDWDDIPFD